MTQFTNMTNLPKELTDYIDELSDKFFSNPRKPLKWSEFKGKIGSIYESYFKNQLNSFIANGVDNYPAIKKHYRLKPGVMGQGRNLIVLDMREIVEEQLEKLGLKNYIVLWLRMADESYDSLVNFFTTPVNNFLPEQMFRFALNELENRHTVESTESSDTDTPEESIKKSRTGSYIGGLAKGAAVGAGYAVASRFGSNTLIGGAIRTGSVLYGLHRSARASLGGSLSGGLKGNSVGGSLSKFTSGLRNSGAALGRMFGFGGGFAGGTSRERHIEEGHDRNKLIDLLEQIEKNTRMLSNGASGSTQGGAIGAIGSLLKNLGGFLKPLAAGAGGLAGGLAAGLLAKSKGALARVAKAVIRFPVKHPVLLAAAAIAALLAPDLIDDLIDLLSGAGGSGTNSIAGLPNSSIKIGDVFSLAAKHESGGDYTAVKLNDEGKASYGRLQLRDQADKFFAQPEVAKHFKGLTKDSPEFVNKFKQVMTDEPEMRKAYDKFMQENYYNVTEEKMRKHGFATSDAGVQQVIGSVALQHGPEGQDKVLGYAKAHLTAIKADMSINPEEKIIKAIQAARIRYMNELETQQNAPGKYDANKNRFREEEKEALALIGQGSKLAEEQKVVDQKDSKQKGTDYISKMWAQQAAKGVVLNQETIDAVKKQNPDVVVPEAWKNAPRAPLTREAIDKGVKPITQAPLGANLGRVTDPKVLAEDNVASAKPKTKPKEKKPPITTPKPLSDEAKKKGTKPITVKPKKTSELTPEQYNFLHNSTADASGAMYRYTPPVEAKPQLDNLMGNAPTSSCTSNNGVFNPLTCATDKFSMIKNLLNIPQGNTEMKLGDSLTGRLPGLPSPPIVAMGLIADAMGMPNTPKPLPPLPGPARFPLGAGKWALDKLKNINIASIFGIGSANAAQAQDGPMVPSIQNRIPMPWMFSPPMAAAGFAMDKAGFPNLPAPLPSAPAPLRFGFGIMDYAAKMGKQRANLTDGNPYLQQKQQAPVVPITINNKGSTPVSTSLQDNKDVVNVRPTENSFIRYMDRRSNYTNGFA